MLHRSCPPPAYDTIIRKRHDAGTNMLNVHRKPKSFSPTGLLQTTPVQETSPASVAPDSDLDWEKLESMTGHEEMEHFP